MLTVATLLWDPNPASYEFSRCYDETWAEKLYRGVSRNLSNPFRFVLYTDRRRPLGEWCTQIIMRTTHPGYIDCLQPYELDEPMILMGLDTVIVGQIDHLAEYALAGGKLALPRDPYNHRRACNGVAVVPVGMQDVWHERHKYPDDMAAVRAVPHAYLDDLWPGHVISYKVDMRDRNLKEPPPDTRIVYFHGVPKMHMMTEAAWIKQHWC
jgi:hypothetical protein